MLDEMSRNNPFTYNICLNAEAAMKRGIKDGDTICVENIRGENTLLVILDMDCPGSSAREGKKVKSE